MKLNPRTDNLKIKKHSKIFKFHGTNGLSIAGQNGAPVVGYFIIGFGLFLIAAGVGIVKTKASDFGGHDGLNVMIGVGLTLMMLGVHLGFWSAHAYIDKARNIVLYRSGLFGMGKTAKHKLSDYDTLKMHFTEGGDDSADEFIITLSHLTNAAESLPLVKCHKRTDAYESLKELENFLGLPVVDTSIGAVSHVVTPDKKPFHTSPLDTLPTDTKLTVTDMGDGLTVTYPAPSMIGGNHLSASLPFFFVLFVFWDVLCVNPPYFAGFILVWGLVLQLAYWKHKKSPNLFSLSINSKNLTIPRPRNTRKNEVIPLTDIQTLSLNVDDEIVPASMRHLANKIIVQTNTDRYEFGWGLSTEDVTHLYNLLKNRT